jgi:Ala-tRNA(Pro) deacylase
MMGLIPGAVTPLGLLNDEPHRVRCFLDESFLEGDGRISVHPNDNTATVFLQAADLIRLLEDHGAAVDVVQI